MPVPLLGGRPSFTSGGGGRRGEFDRSRRHSSNLKQGFFRGFSFWVGIFMVSYTKDFEGFSDLPRTTGPSEFGRHSRSYFRTRSLPHPYRSQSTTTKSSNRGLCIPRTVTKNDSFTETVVPRGWLGFF